jgi:hypothetical protein
VVYRQPNVDKYAINGYSFLRLNQKLASPGDIFESPQGAHAFAIGPNSDVSRVNIAYFDEQLPETYLNKITISPQRSFAELITAFNDTKNYSPSKVPARILIWPAEIFDQTFRPPGFDADNNGLVFEQPEIDIIQAFAPAPGILGARVDKTYYYDTIPFPGEGIISYALVPYYGRRYASIQIQNRSHNTATPANIAGKLNVTVSGINFRIVDPATAPIGHTPLNTLLTLNDNGGNAGAIINSKSFMIGAGYNSQLLYNYDVANADPPVLTTDTYQGGLFDYLLIEIDQGTDPAPDVTDASLRITVSDVVGRTGL